MKKIRLIACWCILPAVIIFQSCSKSGSGGGTVNPPAPANKLTLTLGKTTITADGFEESSFVVKDQNGNDVTSSCLFFVNDQGHAATSFWSETPGTYRIKAQKGSTISPEVTVTATSAGPSPFSQKLLAEDYTGTWCGHCPRVGINLENYAASHPGTIIIGNHGPNGSSDPFTFSQHDLMAGNFGVTGYPNAIINRNFKWNENNSQLNTELARWAPLGLAFETSISSGNITIKSKVKFNVTTNIDMKLVVYLVEDDIVYPQVNYNYFGLPNPISNYVHKGVLRRTGTDLFGDLIDKSKQQKGSIFEKTININVSGLGYNTANLRAIAFVVYGTNHLGKKGVANVQSVKIGENKDFD